MLKRFVVENYKNFKERTEINFGAVRSYSFNDYCTKDGILNKSILLGKNGSGKTNLGLALFDIVGTLTDNTILPEQADQGSFLNGESVNKFAVFEYEFQMGEKTIRYVYHKTDFFNIVYEMMEVDGELVFRRDGKSGEYSGLKEYGAGTLRIDLIDGRLSVLRYVYANTVQDVTSPIAFVMDFVRHMLYFKSDSVGNAFIGYGKAGEDIYGFIADNRLTMDLQRMLGEIAGVETDLSSINMPGVPGTLVQRIGDKQIPFDSVSSSGIRAFVRFYY